MGVQFWWFYDVLVLAVVAGILYSSVSKGFNKMVFHMIGTILAFVIAFFGSSALAPSVYQTIYKENITNHIQRVLEEQDIFEVMAALSHDPTYGAPLGLETEDMRETASQVVSVQQVSAWYADLLSDASQQMLAQSLSPQTDQLLSELFASDSDLFMAYHSGIVGGDIGSCANVLEQSYYREGYTELVRMALFLVMAIVVVIIVGVIAHMTGNLEEIMHIRRCNRLLGFLVGVLETAFVLFAIAVAVKLLVNGTDSQMLLFNEETIEATKIFKLLYQRV